MPIRYRREKVGITQERLAEMLGLERSTVSKWETGDSFPKSSLLPRLANIFGCTIDELFEEVRKENDHET